MRQLAFAALVASIPVPRAGFGAEPVDLLVTGGTVVTMDSAWTVYDEGSETGERELEPG